MDWIKGTADAPKDETILIAELSACGTECEFAVVEWSEDEAGWFDADGYPYEPTHWQRLYLPDGVGAKTEAA